MQAPLHVMVVDDEEDVQWLFRQRFRKEIKAGRLAFHFSFSGEEALAYLHEEGRAAIVLVLSDINMPGMTGLDLLRRLKQEFAALPVHIITAYGNADIHRQALDYGADGYLTKPLDFDMLKQTLDHLES